ncbi:MAG: BA14K family protein [Rhizobiaceae bacterium]
MIFKHTVMSLMAAGAIALTSISSAAALTSVPSKPAPIVSQEAPLLVRDHLRFGGQIIIRKGYRHYNGYRGYREYRSGYGRHNGYWYPGAAFGLGIIIAPTIRNNVYRGNAHLNWCENRYRSYRPYDNSWKPYNGPRRICVSPYY